jgi:hypothetical protein
MRTESNESRFDVVSVSGVDEDGGVAETEEGSGHDGSSGIDYWWSLWMSVGVWIWSWLTLVGPVGLLAEMRKVRTE